ncbi:MAG: hypothetical protein EOO04_38205 [Chitinophagaceae bacterium]|nr:MAG: hypothetical protein EOO04_38205 [Chitinophagaceae bacterium]
MFKTIRFSFPVVLLLMSNILFAQNKTLTGTVRSAAGELLSGVTVKFKNSEQTVLTVARQGADVLTTKLWFDVF